MLRELVLGQSLNQSGAFNSRDTQLGFIELLGNRKLSQSSGKFPGWVCLASRRSLCSCFLRFHIEVQEVVKNPLNMSTVNHPQPLEHVLSSQGAAQQA